MKKIKKTIDKKKWTCYTIYTDKNVCERKERMIEMNDFKESFTLKNFVVSMLGIATVFFFCSEGEKVLLPQIISFGLGVLTYATYRWWPEKEN